MKGTCLEFILGIANNGECISAIKRLVATLATRCIKPHGNTFLPAQRFYFANELVSSHHPLSDKNVRHATTNFYGIDVMFQQVVHLAESEKLVFPDNRNSEERPDEHTQECQINGTRANARQ